jgi:hypothetical protein
MATTDIQDRIVHFFGTSPDDAHNRHRLIFLLIAFFLAGIVFKLIKKDADTVEMVKNFTSTITWLIGIYVGGTVAAQLNGGTVNTGGTPAPTPTPGAAVQGGA